MTKFKELLEADSEIYNNLSEEARASILLILEEIYRQGYNAAVEEWEKGKVIEFIPVADNVLGHLKNAKS